MYFRSSNTGMNFYCLLLFVVFSLFLPVSGMAFDDSGGLLKISLSNSKETEQKEGTFVVHFRAENISDHPLHILRWRTPLAREIGSNMFTVKKDGIPVRYQGKMIKRGPAGPEDFLLLEPGEAVDAEIDLSTLYDTSETGMYSIQFHLKMIDVLEAVNFFKSQDSENVPADFRSNILEAVISVPAVRIQRYKSANFTWCTTDQQNALNTALAASQQIARTAHNDLNNAPANERDSAARYREWFGVYDGSRYSTVQSHFDKLDNALSSQQITFVCDCTEDYFAWVYPNVPYEIHPCNSFWGASVTGTDSQAGTIVHETSHFTVVAGTDDHVYGQTGSRQLADSSPSLAIDNADSHEYFAENTPYLSMPSSPSENPPDNIPPDSLTSIIPVINFLTKQNN